MDRIHIHKGECIVDGKRVVNALYKGDTVLPYNNRTILVENYTLDGEVDNKGKNKELNNVIGFVCEKTGCRNKHAKIDGFPTTAVDEIAEECFDDIRNEMRNMKCYGIIEFRKDHNGQ